MRIVFIIDDTIFFLPEYLDRTISRLKKDENILAVTVLLKDNKRPTIYKYLIKNIWRIGALQISKLLMEFVLIQLKRFLFVLGISNKPMTIKQVAQRHDIMLLYTADVNNKAYLVKLRQLKPDLIISSCSQIFREELLKLPTKGCVNRHSALLPSYGGLFPIFRAIINQEKEIGVTVHKMVKEIDAGEILAQSIIKVKDHESLYSLYRKAYSASVEATILAVEVIRNRMKPRILHIPVKSYFSFPQGKDWERFFNLGYNFI